MTRVLVVDDEPGLRQSLSLLLRDAGYDVAVEADGRRALERTATEPFDIILCDVRMPALGGLDFLRAYRERASGGGGLVIMMSAYGGEDAALAAMKEGAYDYVPKPFRADEVILTLRKAEERERLRRAVATLTARLESGGADHGVVAESRAMRDALDVVGRVADRGTTVLVLGESGTGKEVIARAIHRASPRAGRPFVAVNCAAIPENLLESELFGHVRGAFTGAAADKPGLFEQADGSTLLLDEIGELPLPLQAKLLRALQEGEIRRVGDARTRRVDVRLVAATARDLEAEVRAGGFREDLYYRLNVVTVRLPPLRERPADIAPLAARFAAQLARRFARPLALAPEAVAWLEGQPWPGNVRQLENTIERAAVLTDHDVLGVADLDQDVRPRPGAPKGDARGPSITLRDAVTGAERDAITTALAAAGGNRRDAARRLGVSLRTLFYKMARLGIQ
jgi:two-component system response regulator AtoC